MKQPTSPLRNKLRRQLRLVTAIAISAAVIIPAIGASRGAMAAAQADGSGLRFAEVGQVPVPEIPGVPTAHTGWMIMNSGSRRGYVLSESTTTTKIQSFDLDTLAVRKTVVVPGKPIPTGFGQDGSMNAGVSGDVVHAVDPASKRVYIAMNGVPYAPTGPHYDNDANRSTSYILVFDEEAFDRDPNRAFGAFSVPTEQQRFAVYPLMGLSVTRHHVGLKQPGKLLALFAAPYFVGTITPLSQPVPGPFDHTMTQWDPSGVKADGPPPSDLPTAKPAPLLRADWEQVLTVCATASLSSTEQGDAARHGITKNYQWEVLPTRDAVYLGCQSSPGSGAVARVALNEATGTPVVPGGAQQIVPLGKPIGDVFADPGGRRLYLRSFGKGATWWAFDADTMRFAGAIAAQHADALAMAAGIDHGTGRLYTLTADTCSTNGGSALPIRGGLKMAEARLDPVPAAENVRPDMAYNSWWRIHVDPVKRRVFVRRGVVQDPSQNVYPECDLQKRVDAPVEWFYRVFEDRIPVAQQPGELDDAPFTTDVPEKSGLTQASYLGSGSGYGARTLLTGGLDALASGAPTTVRSMCGREDRELVAGVVNGVDLSDQSTAAEASALDADSRTQHALGSPAHQCRPQAPDGGEQLNQCHGRDLDALAFGPGPDENGDGCSDAPGENRFKVNCLGDTDPPATRGPDSGLIPRDAMRADVVCRESDQKADAKAEAALGSQLIDEFQAQHSTRIPNDPLRITRVSSDVRTARKMGEGVTVTVDSLARGIELPGIGTIGVVRAEATSNATGRLRKAKGTYRRTICDVNVAGVVVRGCLAEGTQASVIKQINDRLTGRAEFRLRQPDPHLLGGTEHGYLAGVQRDRKQLFSDQSITRDRSLAVPALEIMLYQGEGGAWGAGRQVIQLAGVQAATSYGIACLYGQGEDGKCLEGDEGGTFGPDPGGGDGETVIVTEREEVPGETKIVKEKGESRILRFLKKIPQAIAQAMRLLFNNPRELALLAAVWGLLYAPCYLGERRRSIARLVARRAVGGV